MISCRELPCSFSLSFSAFPTHKVLEGGIGLLKGKPWKLIYILTIIGTLVIVHWGNQAVTVIAENMPLPRRNCIIIDPGHGGIDGGTASSRGKLEKEYNLEISLRLCDLMRFLGYSVRTTRSTDKSIHTEGETIAEKKISDLKNRVQIIEQTENPILISIHQNYFPDSRYHGPQVFYADTTGSAPFAEVMQTKLSQCLNPGGHRQPKKSEGVYLMDKINCPGVLVECGFLSNPQEERILSDPVYQKKLCSVIAGALCHFLTNA